MRPNCTTCVITILAVCVTVSHGSAQSGFQWHGRLAAGQTIEVKGINGDVRAMGSSSADVEVSAARSARRSNPDDVRIEVVPSAADLVEDRVVHAHAVDALLERQHLLAREHGRHVLSRGRAVVGSAT